MAHHAVHQQRLGRGNVLDLPEHVLLADLGNEGIFALFIVALPEQLLPDLGRTAAERHLMKLRHVVAQAQSDAGVFLDKELHRRHDALGRFIKRIGARVALSHHGKHPAAIRRLTREEAVKQKGREVEAGDGQCRDRRAAAGNADHADSRADRRADQLVAGIGNTGRARVRDDGDIFPLLQLLDKEARLAVLVEFMVCGKRVAANAKLVEQHDGAARILRRDDIRRRQDLTGALGDIA